MRGIVRSRSGLASGRSLRPLSPNVAFRRRRTFGGMATQTISISDSDR